MTIVLIALLGMEILPWGFVESVSVIPVGERERTFRIEPLQVCDHGDSALGLLFDLPVLLPGPPCLCAPTEALCLARQASAFLPDGFHPALDRPPRLRA